ncbi:endophilin-B2 isoform X2 [Falco biarmicus]|uniref:endophilin-B2 isoform X2 n=1 Tax=Falco rusticolus TaxID=120794 RepID=UPI0018869DC6|nr:endophilin-B2 isoform X2 [Falco rusticolus]XP_040463642.1 endophilin-B2 isoform X2 [Falco naumanni]XP_055577010.1 endophilin-B2 isoform X1 [Falco cherrug]XP_055651557.1 endophilin-B2 isoform X1 [Falco peregrinus]XP_056207237.1 endophilin-B2 isoform X2 [Falco biarmicus]
MDFNVKKLASDAGVFFSRAMQFTEEKLGQAEKTELDAHFENLLARADCTKNWTEKILRQTEVLLQPNPSARVEEFLYEKLDRKVPSRVTNGELLAQYMTEAANDFGPGTPYGKTLIKVGETQRRLGAAERDFIHSASINFLTPLRNFLEGDWRTISKERRILQNRRLDLDACKARLKKAKAAEAKAAAVPDFQETRPRNYVLSASASALWSDEVEKAEHELRLTQTEFDRQAEVTRLLLEGISSTHVNHLRCLHEFVESQTNYYAQCYQYMLDLQKQLGSSKGEIFSGTFIGNAESTSPPPAATSPPAVAAATLPAVPTIPVVPTIVGVPSTVAESVLNPNEVKPPASGTRKARVLYDYEAADSTELALLADEMITVYSLPGMDPDWLIGERGNQKGKVPVTYLELLS